MNNKFKRTLLIGMAVITMVMTACQKVDSSFNSNYSSFNSNFSSGPTTSYPNSNLKKASKLLRSPEGLDHKYSYEDISSPEYLAFKEKIKAFSSKLSEAFVKDSYTSGKNLTFSPLSVELCLGLAVRSAKGQTRQEMLDAFGVDYETFNKYYKLFYNENNKVFLNEEDKYQGEISLTNSIWIDDEVTLKEEGLDALQNDYYCYSYETDFNHNNEGANLAIKEFINEKTKGLINPDLKLSDYTVFILMNTLYMKDMWSRLGDELEYAPIDYKFTNSNGLKSDKRLLSGNYTSGKVLVTDDYSSFYASTAHGIKIHFIKPNNNKSLLDVFSKENINYVLDSNNYTYQDDDKKEEYYTKCIFPSFEVETSIELKEMMQRDIGINLFFSDSCDFSNLSPFSVKCDSLLHIAKLIVDKKGTEGAAVTIMEMTPTSMPYEPYKRVYDTFSVDQEFGYVLSYNDTVLFSGVVTNID